MAAVIRRGGNPFYRDKKGFEGSNPSIKNANPSFTYPIDTFSTLIYMGVEFFVYGSTKRIKIVPHFPYLTALP